MTDAQARWRKAGQASSLFPIDRSQFKLHVAEVSLIRDGRRRLAWRVSWLVFVDAGRHAALPEHATDSYLPVEHASIALTVSLTGRIVAGSASWRPTKRPLVVDQRATPAEVLKIAQAARGKPGPDTAHGHTDPGAPVGVAMSYSAGTRSEFRNFLDPRLRYFGPVGHGHGPPFVVPATRFGLNVEILSVARRIDSTGVVQLHPWVTTCDGALSTTRMPAGHQMHWSVLDLNGDAVGFPMKIDGGRPLQLRGLYRVAFTVSNDRGCIAHSHLEVGTHQDARSPELVG